MEEIEETVEEEQTLDAPEEEETETVDWEAEAKKAKELADNYKVRAEKAEKKAKDAPKAQPDSNLSTADILALSKAQIEAEDLEDVLEWATFKKITVQEALQSSTLKATLAEKAELRKSALAVNTGTGRRATTNLSDERLLADAQKGNLPDSDADIARLAKLRFSKK
jgi:3-oxoacyl-(acyl-carrier-protein) synthase